MTRGVSLERVRRDINAVAHAGHDTATFAGELDRVLQRAVPFTAACIVVCDPATMLLTGTYKLGDLRNHEEHGYEWGLIEYGDAEPTTFSELVRTRAICAGVHQATGGDVSRSRRFREFVRPHYNYTDEVRVIAREDGRPWGAIALFRGDNTHPFDLPEIAFLRSLSPILGAGIRAGLLARLAAMPASAFSDGPLVIIIGRNDEIRQLSAGAVERLADIAASTGNAESASLLSPLVAGARRYAAGRAGTLPRSRVRLASGQWLVLHASPLAAGTPGAACAHAAGDVVVTIEEARPPEVIPLVVAAFELTPRERDVTQLILQGMDTAEIARTLCLSAYTVQDYLKSVFEKAGVRSRRELTTRVFFDQYVPRLGAGIAPSGWFIAP